MYASLPAGRATVSASSGDSTRTIASGASPIVPSTSSWPAWPIEDDRVAVARVVLRLGVHLRDERARRVDRLQLERRARSRGPTVRRRARRRRPSPRTAPRSRSRRRSRRAPRGRARRGGCGRSASARRPAGPRARAPARPCPRRARPPRSSRGATQEGSFSPRGHRSPMPVRRPRSGRCSRCHMDENRVWQNLPQRGTVAPLGDASRGRCPGRSTPR